MSEGDRVLLFRLVVKYPAATSTDLRRSNPFLKDICQRTIRRRLQYDCKFRTRKARRRPLLKGAMRRNV